MKYPALMLLLLIACTPLFAQEAAIPKRQEADFLPMAVWYGGGKARAPMLEPNARAKMELWRADLLKIRELGFNSIKCWVDWATVEPQEGQFRFDTLEVIAELTQQIGLKFFVQIYADSAPDWVGKRYPDSHFVDISGAVMPSESAPGFCSDHPGVKKALEGFLSGLALRLKDRPSFKGWDLWSEPHVINWATATYLRNAEFCFCPHTVARYREWLKQKYGTLQTLNQAWYRNFTDWQEVQPNRLSTILSYTDYVDWRFFLVDKLAQDLAARYLTVKRILPRHLATSHAAAPSLFTSPLAGDGSPDDWKMAQQVDYWGTSFYPKHSAPVGRDVAWRGALLDFSRSSCAGAQNGFYLGELQSGFGTIALRVSATVTPEDQQVWLWSSLARGAKGINIYAWYPMSSGYESGGFGLIHLDGTITARAVAAGKIARLVDQNQDFFLKARPMRAQVAIVYNPLAYMVGGRQPLPTAGGQGEFSGIERNSLLGLYRALFPSNVPLDFIHIDDIAAGKAASYRLLLLPYPLMITEKAAKGLAEFVRQGGSLYSEARLAWNDERGFAQEIIPGFGLHQVAGCRESAVQQAASGKTALQVAARDESIPLLQIGEKIPGSSYEETLEPSTSSARIVARFGDGSPAMIAHSYGQGKMLSVGTFLGVAYESDRDPNLAKFLTGLLDWAGVDRPVEMVGVTDSQTMEVRILELGAERLAVIFNHSDSEKEPLIRIKIPDGSYALRDFSTGQPFIAAHENHGLLLKKRLTAREVWVVRMTPQP